MPFCARQERQLTPPGPVCVCARTLPDPILREELQHDPNIGDVLITYTLFWGFLSIIVGHNLPQALFAG